MTRRVLWLAEVDQQQQGLVGNKAARLGELLSAGFSIPDGFCITVDSFSEHIIGFDSDETGKLIQQGLFREIQAQALHVTLSHALQEEILTNYRRLASLHPGAVAVRSSSNAEDLFGHSFAGLYETVLNVTDEAMLLDAVRSCWASYWSEEAVDYRQQIGMDHTQYGMAVLVQAMISPKYAGVLFTQAPMANENNSSLVEFITGNGSRLVDGSSYTGRYLIERNTGEIQAVSCSEQLPVDTLRHLVSLGRAIEKFQKGPQDIEWCLDTEDRVWILQTRPITSHVSGRESHTFSAPVGLERVYDEPFSTLGCDLAVRRHQFWVTAINQFHHTGFRSEAVTDGIFVYHTTPWRSVGFLLRIWMRFWKFIRWIQAGYIQNKYDQKVLPTYASCLKELQQRDLSDLDDGDVMDGLNSAIRLYLEFQCSSYAAGEIAVMAASILERTSRFMFNQFDNSQTMDFLAGLDTVTVKRDIALQTLGVSLSKVLSPEELETLDHAGLLARRSDLNLFWNEMRDFQDTYGYVWADRYPRDPAWQVNTEALMASLRHAVRAGANQGMLAMHKQRAKERSQNINRTADKLSANTRFPIRWILFGWFLHRAEAFFPYKENRNHSVYQGVMVIQKYAREIGLRLQAKGILSSSDDIFFITWEEIQAIFSRGPTESLVSQIKARKLAYRLQVQNVTSEGAASVGGREVVGNPSNDLLKGVPCSSGVGTGLARLVRGPGDLQRVMPGEVMVCRHFRPAWSPVFARLSGAVIEEGGVLSHGATLAREYGIPAVINVPGAMRSVQDGSCIVVDGTRGLVLLSEAGTAREYA